MSNDSVLKTFLVAFLLCIVCSVLVCLAALVRIDREGYNQQLALHKAVLGVDGFQQQIDDGGDVDKLFADNMELKIVDLATGEFTTAVDPATYDQSAAREDANLSITIPKDQDIAGIGKRAKYAAVYLCKNGDIILPIWGTGFQDKMYAYVALKSDASTVVGLSFYDQSETPGLGGEVENPHWKAQWAGKTIYDASGKLAIQLVKNGTYNPSAADANSTVDGLAGATQTTLHVNKIVRYWFGENGYAKFLANLKAKRG